MGARINLTGQKFNRLTVIARAGVLYGEVAWLCLCECGSRKIIGGREIRSGRVQSCGCLIQDVSFQIGMANRTHGLTATSEWKSWRSMRDRCQDLTNFRYGGRGIQVCEEWRNDFEAFYRYMGPKPGPGYSLDRINNDGNYEPGNVRWATAKEQANNRGRGHSYKEFATLLKERDGLATEVLRLKKIIGDINQEESLRANDPVQRER